ncbi:sphingosine N-acyltransferase lag1 [Mortierella sp. NVP85]|nr:sphingosine N-acyltransferase lag1 [Mortierella sp. NVP85]
MVLSDSRQPILSVSSPLSNIALLHKDTTDVSGQKPLDLSASRTSSFKKSGSFGGEKGRSMHENAKRKQRRLVEGNGGKSVLAFMYHHQIDVPAAFIATVLISHFGLRLPLAETFLILQNRDPVNGLYSKAWTDLNFIFFWITVFTLLRATVMTMILKPLAIRCGVKKEHHRNRFQEEGWVCLYYSVSWSLGMYVMRNSPMWNNWFFWFKPEAFFEGYPHTQLPHVMFWYYYVQLAFWLQQIFVLHIEAPRKDFWALLSHHTVTLLLISGSAISNFWMAGTAVFVVMDLADIILAFSKSIKYLGVSSRICDCFFTCFMVTWIYTRHYLYGYILHSFMFTAYEMIPFELNISQGKWYCKELAWLPILGLGLLQLLMIYWFALILRIVLKILKGHNAEDDRSDDEQEPADAEK